MPSYIGYVNISSMAAKTIRETQSQFISVTSMINNTRTHTPHISSCYASHFDYGRVKKDRKIPGTKICYAINRNGGCDAATGIHNQLINVNYGCCPNRASGG